MAGETALVAAEAGLHEVSRIINECLDTAIAPGTLQIYRRVRRDFLAFADKFRVPFTAIHKLRNVFLAHLINKGRTRTLGYHLAALSHFFGPLPSVDEEIQRALLRTGNRSGPTVRHRSKAVQEDVDKIVDWALQKNSTATIKGASMVMLAFLGFLRVSELVQLRFADVSHKGGNLWWLAVRRSKTDQEGKGSVVAFRMKNTEENLWRALYRIRSPRSSEDFLFSCRSGKPPSRDYAFRLIKKTFVEAGLASRNLTPHSFRGGAATTAIRRGVDPANVMRVGRWKSVKSFQCYIDPTPL
ncbi:site-specific recombinase, phage integrase family [Ancylostoma duodenale]|uniref:Site-specific recombinase, phage integrase family n=1 Tax=Ancylostoma duodenale TaxID=51022 RepID=A0A0C2GP01_9BILA|nr:site-specific recombinase, phage integrase family [Ancylostoma duodenale]